MALWYMQFWMCQKGLIHNTKPTLQILFFPSGCFGSLPHGTCWSSDPMFGRLNCKIPYIGQPLWNAYGAKVQRFKSPLRSYMHTTLHSPALIHCQFGIGIFNGLGPHNLYHDAKWQIYMAHQGLWGMQLLTYICMTTPKESTHDSVPKSEGFWTPTNYIEMDFPASISNNRH